jgi:fructan beta-fructosidase
VLIQGSGKYSIGTFDGREFKEESPRRPCDIGPNFYATQTWANTETGDGRRIQTAWVQGAAFPDMPFSQEISFPCELTLRTTSDGLRLFREPVREIASLHKRAKKWSNVTLPDGGVLELLRGEEFVHIKAEVSIPDRAKLTFRLRGETVVLTSKGIQSGSASGAVMGSVRTVEILLDRGSIETFVNHGEVSSTRFALQSGDTISVKAEGGPVTIKSLTLHPLKSMWDSKQRGTR